MTTTDWILSGRRALASSAVGGKARALADAEAAGLPVPPWIVIPSTALPAAIDEDLSPELIAALSVALAAVAPGQELLAVRSSALDEDGIDHSFAGQLESFLNVHPADVAGKVRAVWRSGFSERVLAYRRERGISAPPRAPAVIVQRMVAPRAAGVAFSADPVSGRMGIAVVSAIYGFGTAVVSGEADADTWHVDRHGAIVERRIAKKDRMHVADSSSPDGVRSIPVEPAAVARPTLQDDEVLAIAALARQAATHFQRPQDIEWAIADRLFLLQSRPITSLASVPDPDAPRIIWDNSNIVESYSGVTTPLTFSFAREIYEHVYREFCRMMAVPERVISAQEDTFRNMLGLIRGRLYYNLLNWYRLLAMLPGFHINRGFMEQMMGVKEPLPDDIAASIGREMSIGRVRDAAHLARALARLVSHHLRIETRVDRFYQRLNAALAPPDPPLEDRRIDELAAHYRELRAQLLLHWDAPLVNDFFAMIFYGALRSLVVRWCGDPGGTLQNDLIAGDGGMVSAEPAVRMQQLASLAREAPPLLALLANGSADDIAVAIREHPAIESAIGSYLAKFGDRTVNELKLESSTLHDDPLPFFRAVAALAAQPNQPHGDASPAERLRHDARARVAKALARHPARRAVFHWVLRHAKRRVRGRENLRLERTRLFGRVRRIFVEMGRRLHAAGRLDDPRDIFYLEIDDVLAFVEGRATTVDLAGLAAVRRREFAAYSAGPPPADRFETRGAVYHGNAFASTRRAANDDGDRRSGLGCSPGIVRGPVRVVRDPTTVDPGHGAILVAEHTDPGWIMIFPSARAVLVERGSLLSHAAIVARELGIPAIVSLPGLTQWLKDGDWVEMDGSTGVVRRISPTDAPHA